MKRLLTIVLLSATLPALAQKPALDHSVYDAWESVTSTVVSAQGNVVGYVISPQEGDGRLVLQAGKRQHTIARGHRLTITPDEKYAICLVSPLFEQTRQAKIKKKKDLDMPQDTLLILRLSDFGEQRIAHVSGYVMGKKDCSTLAFLSSDTAMIAKKERKTKDIGRPLMVRHLSTGITDTINYVKDYAFDHYGQVMTYTTQTKKNHMQAAIYDVHSRQSTHLTDTTAFVTRPVLDEQGRQLLFTASADTVSDGTRRCQLYYAARGEKSNARTGKSARKQHALQWQSSFGKPECIVSAADTIGWPEGWSLNQHTTPSFSHDGKRIIAGIAPWQAPKDTTLVAFETAGLDVWVWNQPETPTMQNINRSRELKRTYTAVYNPERGLLQPLSDKRFEQVRLINRGDAPYALAVDRTESMIESQWEGHITTQLSLIEVSNGQRRQIAKGLITDETASPGGRYVAWYDFGDAQWHIYDIATGIQRRLTSAEWGVNFYDEEYDCPEQPYPYGIAGWTQDDREVIIYDRYDLWKIPTGGQGKPVCLTKGEGRRTCRTYRYVNIKHEDEARFILPREKMLLRVFDNTTKQNGLATVEADRPAPPAMFTFGGYTYTGVKRAEAGNTLIYQRGNFQEPMDVYRTTDNFATSDKLTAINPQQKDYNWGTAELYHWTAYDGRKLDGILYKPEDFDPQRKYPVMIYFYERRSESLYSYVMPQPSWSTVNLAFYTSRGYIVFVPDIVYPLDGMPGEAAYNCVVSGAESLKQYPWIDGQRMAIQGQSWGGYQVAYLITRTNMFRAAGAGAPVSNMTSAYGGIRWESGMSRQFQYEHSQSRIGKTLWQAPDLYIKNSCLFTLPNVNTPVLIMHNDNDGAVPWYQGIEMFMGLKRLQKPVWLLQYNNESHNLRERRNRKDLTIRLQQFFDHYLKDAPMPAWMKTGIPATRKGQYFGLEE